jgi:hypothetical protein
MYVTRLEDQKVQRQMFGGRLRQITEHVDRIERDLADVYELVNRMQQDLDAESDAAEVADQDLRLARDRSVTSACWDRHPLIQEDSATL